MHTTSPATGPAFACRKLGAGYLNPVTPGIWFFGIFNPADPLIAGEGSEALPGR